MQVGRLFPQVGYQGQATKAIGPQVSGAAPIAAAIGQAAGAAGQWAQKYQEAQYATDATAAELEIKKRINTYHENLRTNPIQPIVGEDVVQTKEADWNKFSKDLQDNYINKIENGRLKEDLGNWWASASEDGRSGVVENAMDENIIYMGQAQLERINTFTTGGDYDAARRANAVGVDTGLYSRQQHDDNADYINRVQVTNEAMELEYKEGITYIDNSNLPVHEKTTAKKVLDDRKKQEELAYKEWVKTDREASLDDLGLRASTGQLATVSQYDAEIAAGGHKNLESKDDEWVRERIRIAERDRERTADGGIVPDSKAAESLIDSLFRNPDANRADILSAMYYLGPNITATQYKRYYDLMDSDAYERLNNNTNTYVDNQLDAMEKDGLFGEDELDITNARARIESVIFDKLNGVNLSGLERATEAGFSQDDAEQLFYNERQKAIGFNLDKINTLREVGGDRIESTPEELLQFGLEGRLYGQTQEDALGQFILDESMTSNQLREVAAKKYGVAFKDLSKDQKAQVNLTASVGNLLRLTKDLFTEDYPDINGVLAVDPATGLPAIHTRYEFTSKGQTEIRDRMYRLNYNKAKQEEVWEYYSEQDGAWVTDPSASVPNLHKLTAAEKAIESIQNSYTALRDVDPGPIDESARILAEHQRLTEEELLELDEGSVLGNVFKGMWEKIFSGE